MSPRTRRTKHDSITNKENAKMNGHEADTKTVRAKSKRKVYCTCRQPDDGMPMISCSECDEWYHFTCVDLSENDAEDIRLYICPSCHQKTGLCTVMKWEGPEAVEERTARQKPSTSQLKSTRSRAKAKAPEPEEEEESSSHDESEDDYVVGDPKPQLKRRTRKLSLSDETASSDDTDSGAQKAPKRLRRSTAVPKDATPKRESESPGPSNTRKRRPSTITHANPQPKRRKSESTAEDATRKYCYSKLEEVFTQIFLRYPILPQDEIDDSDDDIKPSKKTEELTPEEKELVETKARAFVAHLEECLFELYAEPDKAGKPHAGPKYKERFRMLTFNLSKADRVVLHMRIASSHISAKELSMMTSTDLANEEQKQSIKQAEKEALAQTILKKTILPRAKMTHKGIQDIEDVNGAVARERETEAAEEDRIERERQARLRLQAERAQAQAANQGSAPPDSPITPTWGGPPPLPGRSLFGSDALAHSSEGELNLADLINIDDEPTSDDMSISLTIPPSEPVPAVPPSPSIDTPQSAEPKLSATSPASHATGISPFAAKPDTAHRPSFDLSALWSPAKEDGEAKAEQDVILVDEPEHMEGDHKSPQQTSMEVDVLSNGGGSGDQDFDMFLQQDEDKEAPSQPSIPETKPPTFDELPHVWTGKISMPLDSAVPQEVTLSARQVGGRSLGGSSPLWRTLFPVDHLRIDGRVPTDKSAEYLTQTRLNSAKELIAAAFNPSSEDSNSAFQALIRYLLSKGRHGLVFPWGPRPKDNHPGRELYIIPLLSSEVIPEYMELLDDLQLPKTRDSDLLIGIWVLNKGKLVAPSSTPPIPSVPPTAPIQFQSSQIATPQDQPPSTENPAVPSYPAPANATPYSDSSIEATLASLTPEQIQAMLQQIQASTAPQVPSPIGIPQASLQQWTNPPPNAAPAYPTYAPGPNSSSMPPYMHSGPPNPPGPAPYHSNYDYDQYSDYPEYPRDQYDSYGGGRRGGPRGGGGDRGPRHRGRGRNNNRGGYGGPRDGGWKRGRGRGGPSSPPRDGGRWSGGPPPSHNGQWS